MNYRCVSNQGELQFENYLRIDNSITSAHGVAKTIKDHFKL